MPNGTERPGVPSDGCLASGRAEPQWRGYGRFVADPVGNVEAILDAAGANLSG
jgi:hypothetical protein